MVIVKDVKKETIRLAISKMLDDDCFHAAFGLIPPRSSRYQKYNQYNYQRNNKYPRPYAGFKDTTNDTAATQQ